MRPFPGARVRPQFIVTYWLIDLQGNFFRLVGAAWGLSVAAASLALVVGCVAANAQAAGELSPIVFVPQLLFAGFFVRSAQIPVWLRWSQWLCAIKYALNLISIVEFDPELSSCQGLSAAHHSSGWLRVTKLLGRYFFLASTVGLYLQAGLLRAAGKYWTTMTLCGMIGGCTY